MQMQKKKCAQSSDSVPASLAFRVEENKRKENAESHSKVRFLNFQKFGF